MTGRALSLLAGVLAMNLQWFVFQGRITTLHSAWGWEAKGIKCATPQAVTEAEIFCKQADGIKTEILPGTKCKPTCSNSEHVPDKTAEITCPTTECSGTTAEINGKAACKKGKDK